MADTEAGRRPVPSVAVHDRELGPKVVSEQLLEAARTARGQSCSLSGVEPSTLGHSSQLHLEGKHSAVSEVGGLCVIHIRSETAPSWQMLNYKDFHPLLLVIVASTSMQTHA